MNSRDTSKSNTKRLDCGLLVDREEHCDITLHRRRDSDGYVCVCVENRKNEYLERCEESKRAFWKNVQPKQLTTCHEWHVDADTYGSFLTWGSPADWFMRWDADNNVFHMVTDEEDNTVHINEGDFELDNFLQEDDEEGEDEDEDAEDDEDEDEDEDEGDTRAIRDAAISALMSREIYGQRSIVSSQAWKDGAETGKDPADTLAISDSNKRQKR
ncbi:hypothetical protein CYMTET_5335 [Cymbomonas tetramitiformis]|uniref:Uncharacterized protein n=1 Tax=Cymbomonas tetramitiformis TaxID=36881 RepID=A0AAE0GZN4_9CHLO|nr:hypothetical protein CYMTET_37027 [Cymbomonas tetramitiformis]KAK3287153.1 hypothetical protein CYMTET_5335 [Cymbomonas tetramitiformis]